MANPIYKNPLEQARADFEEGKISQGELDDVAIAEFEKNKAPIFNQADQDARRKAKKRWIGESIDYSHPERKTYFIDGDPSKYVRWFDDYPSANDYLNQLESKEEARKQALLDRYYSGEGDLEQLHQDILNAHNGNIKAAFEWLFNNANKRR